MRSIKQLLLFYRVAVKGFLGIVYSTIKKVNEQLLPGSFRAGMEMVGPGFSQSLAWAEDLSQYLLAGQRIKTIEQ